MAAAALTCNACRYTMADADSTIRSQHYSSQWHRYNVKRKCAQLPPISANEFNVIASAAGSNQPSTSTYSCCNKTFASKTSYDNHQMSKKHKKAECKSMAREPSSDDFVVLKPVPAAIPIGTCLFCDLIFDDGMVPCLEHMTKSHGFFIPYREYLTDLEGLLLYFGCKVGIGHVCVHCNATFKSLQAVQAHMHAKSHCKMRWEPELDNDEDLAADDDDHFLIEKDAFEFDEFYDFDSDMMTDDDQSAVIVAGNRPEIERINEMGELVISNGNVIGHRDYKLIYRQRVGTFRTVSDNRRQIQAMKLIGSAEMAVIKDITKRSQRVERLRQRQHLNYQFRAHRLAKFFKQQVPL